MRKGNHKLVPSDTREDSVKDRAGHWLQAGWRLWRDSWDLEGRRAAAGLLPLWLHVCLSSASFQLACCVALPQRGEGHSGCNYIIAPDYQSTLCFLCTHPHLKVFMLLKCFEFKCCLFLPVALKDLESVFWKWSQVMHFSNGIGLLRCLSAQQKGSWWWNLPAL